MKPIELSHEYKALCNKFLNTTDTHKYRNSASLSLLSDHENPILKKLFACRQYVEAENNPVAEIPITSMTKGNNKSSILFAPLVIAGKAPILSSYLRTRGFKTAVIDYFPNYLNYNSDYRFTGRDQKKLIQFLIIFL